MLRLLRLLPVILLAICFQGGIVGSAATGEKHQYALSLLSPDFEETESAPPPAPAPSCKNMMAACALPLSPRFADRIVPPARGPAQAARWRVVTIDEPPRRVSTEG